MNTHLVFPAAVALVLMGTSHAGQPKTGNASKAAAMEFNALTGEWKPARPRPVVAQSPLTRTQRKAQSMPWTLPRAAMQPLRLVVMAAKVPLIPAGFVAMNGSVLIANLFYGANMDFFDFGPALDTFDPGPAIDADLERMAPRNAPHDKNAPTPFKSELQVSGATSASAARPAPKTELALGR